MALKEKISFPKEERKIRTWVVPSSAVHKITEEDLGSLVPEPEKDNDAVEQS